VLQVQFPGNPLYQGRRRHLPRHLPPSCRPERLITARRRARGEHTAAGAELLALAAHRPLFLWGVALWLGAGPELPAEGRARLTVALVLFWMRCALDHDRGA
jgi:hypothetical protein